MSSHSLQRKSTFKSSNSIISVVLISLFIAVFCSVIILIDSYENYKSLAFIDDYERVLLYARFRYRAMRKRYKEPFDNRIVIISVGKEALEGDKLPTIFWSKHF